MADSGKIDRKALRQYKALLKRSRRGLHDDSEPSANVSITFLPQENAGRSPLRFEVVNDRDRPLKVHTVRLMGKWPDRVDSLHDHPGLIWEEPELVRDIPPEDRATFMFPSSETYYFSSEPPLEGFYCEIELKNKRKIRSDLVTRREPSTKEKPKTKREIRDLLDDLINQGRELYNRLRKEEENAVSDGESWISHVDEFAKAYYSNDLSEYDFITCRESMGDAFDVKLAELDDTHRIPRMASRVCLRWQRLEKVRAKMK